MISAPAPSTFDVPRDDPIVLVFTSPLDATSVNMATVSLRTPTSSQAITLTVDGAMLTITPNSALAPETLYTLTVGTGVRNTSGAALENPIVLPFTIAARQWQVAQHLESSDNDAQLPQLAVGSQGTVFAVWQQSDNQNGEIPTRGTISAARSSDHGRTWSAAQNIGLATQEIVSDPYLAVDSAGAAIAVWIQGLDHPSVWANRYHPATAAWGEAHEISREVSDLNELAWGARAVFDSNGNTHAFYQSNGQVRARFSMPGGPWQPATKLEEITPDVALRSDVAAAADGNGNVLAVWGYSFTTAPGYSIVFSRYRPGSGWSPPQSIAQDTKRDLGEATLRIVCNAEGDAAIVWSTITADRSEVLASRYSISDEAWNPAKNLGDPDETRAGQPNVAIDREGNIAVLWQQSRGLATGIEANRYSVATDSWGTTQVVATAAGVASRPIVAIGPGGNLFAAWEFRATPGDLPRLGSARGALSSDTWTELEPFQDDEGDSAFSPQIALTASGDVVVLWQQENADGVLDTFANAFR